jgi:fructose-1,6-bisphosphatase II / sedoheptulose-1,7-bisphosphatase
MSRGSPAPATPASSLLTRALSLEVARVSEAAAVAAASLRGRGDERAADQAAGVAMREELNRLPLTGTVVIGEGEAGEVPMLFLGDKVGEGGVPADIAVDPLEGATLCAKALPNALSVLAVAAPGSLLKVPDIYMEKIAIGPGYAPDTCDLDLPPAENLARLAAAKGVSVAELSVCILDRPRHAKLIEEVRSAGAAIQLISDGDIAGVIHASKPLATGIDIYLGTGGAPEGVLAAAALRCIGGQLQGRLIAKNDGHRMAAAEFGFTDLSRKYAVEDMAGAEVIFAATGITDGSLLRGVKFHDTCVETNSVIMRSTTGTVRWVVTQHEKCGKFPI